MTAGNDSDVESVLDDTQVFIEGLLSRQSHLFENMIIGRADKNTRLPDAQAFYQPEILLFALIQVVISGNLSPIDRHFSIASLSFLL